MKLVTNAYLLRLLIRSYFNPHEREARDATLSGANLREAILIHTSVKLVTIHVHVLLTRAVILIHTSVKLVTSETGQERLVLLF